MPRKLPSGESAKASATTTAAAPGAWSSRSAPATIPSNRPRSAGRTRPRSLKEALGPEQHRDGHQEPDEEGDQRGESVLPQEGLEQGRQQRDGCQEQETRQDLVPAAGQVRRALQLEQRIAVEKGETALTGRPSPSARQESPPHPRERGIAHARPVWGGS
jgi:hypothetical protein